MMSKSEDKELQKFTFPPRLMMNGDEDTNLTETNVSSKYTTTNIISGSKGSTSVKNTSTLVSSEKKKVEKTQSGPASASRIPSFKLSTPNSHGYTKVTYSSEKKQESKKNERHLNDSTPQKRETSSLFPWSSKTSSTKQSPLMRRSRDEKKVRPEKHLGIPTRSQTPPDGVSKSFRSLVGVRNKRMGYGSPIRVMERPTQHHTFPPDAADVQQIEKKLLQLMVDFEAGHLSAFGQNSRLRQMEEIREQQEKLAKLHFDVGADQELYLPLSEEGLKKANENMNKLMNRLANLSESIENLHSNSHLDRKGSVVVERKSSLVGLNSPLTSVVVDSAVAPPPLSEKNKHSPPPNDDYKSRDKHSKLTGKTNNAFTNFFSKGSTNKPTESNQNPSQKPSNSSGNPPTKPSHKTSIAPSPPPMVDNLS